MVFVVRHALAVRKRAWTGRDAERPLESPGVHHAKDLTRLFEGRALARMVSSPTVRCVDTLAPLARRRGAAIDLDDTIAVGAPPGRFVKLVLGAPDGTIMCTHGELMRPLLARLRADRAGIVTELDDDRWLLAKGGVWAIEHEDGRAVSVVHAAPGWGWAAPPLMP